MPHKFCSILLCFYLFVVVVPVAQSQEEGVAFFESDKRDPVGHRIFSPLASFLLPGTGQMFHGEWLKGEIHLGVYIGFAYARNAHSPDGDFRDRRALYEDEEDSSAIYVNRDSLFYNLYGSAAFNTSLYSAFDAYRVATLSRDDVPIGAIPVSDESFTQLVLSPFNLDYLFDPYVFVPIVTAMVIYANATEGVGVSYHYEDDTNKSEIRAVDIVRHEFVAIGEETFFRGIVNTETVRYMGPITGIMASGLTFGLAHTGQSGSANAATATAYGVYMGYLHLKNSGALGPNIALHYWWNTIISLSYVKQGKEAEVTIPLIDIKF